MFEVKNIVENSVRSADCTTLVAAVTAAGPVGTLFKTENKERPVKGVAPDLSAAKIVRNANAYGEGFHHFNALLGDALSEQIEGGKVYV